LELAGLKPAEAIPLLAPLLNLALSPKYPPSTLSPEQQRRRLLAALVELALGFARVQPTVISTEDLHWADPSTLELIQLLVEQGAQARLLLLYTARPEFRAQWPMRPHHTQITLNRLSARNVRTMVAQVAARAALPEETVAAMVERTGGVPLFVEELTRSVLESGTSRLVGREIPATLRDTLMARLDRLGPAKEVIQVGAVIGGEFSYELLHAVHPFPEADLRHALNVLAGAELLYERGVAPQSTYQFKHALIHDAAYEALLKSRRKELHRMVARTINEKFSALKDIHPEVLARHWTQAGETEPAIAQWTRAGEVARERNAFPEAQESCRQALALLGTLSESPERELREMELTQSIAFILTVTRGHAAPETIEAIERLAALAEKSGNLKQLVNMLSSRFMGMYMSGNHQAIGILADQALELAIREGTPASLALAHDHQILARSAFGDFAGVEKHFAQWLQYCDDPEFKRKTIPGTAVVPFGYACWNAWTLGRADLARAREARMMAAVDANGNNPHDVAYSAYFAATLRIYLKDYEQAEALAARALEVSLQNKFPNMAAFDRCTLGLARAVLGHPTEGLGLIREGIAGLVEVGAQPSGYFTSLAGAQALAGDLAGALATVEQALEANADSPTARAGTLTLRGELRLAQGQTELAEQDLREAVAATRSVGAIAPELGATMSLARLLAKKDQRDEARAMLAEIYASFTEGFDTADLKNAKALLEELSHQAGEQDALHQLRS
jgi:tetratricopeptide (TPR) repeat protein